MHILFIHQAFPAQFGQIGSELAARNGWRCTALVESMSACPTPSAEMLNRVEVIRYRTTEASANKELIAWPRGFGAHLEVCQAVQEAVISRPDLRPDLVVAHGGRGAPSLFVPDVLDCPVAVYCEYYFAPSHSDLSYRIDLPDADRDVERLYPRCINAPTLLALTEADTGYAPTRWQKDGFPARFHSKIDVCFDGIDTAFYRPARARRPYLLEGRTIDDSTRVVTFVARGLESMRGFDLFLKVAERIARERTDVLFVIAGSDQTYYGWDLLRTGGRDFRSWIQERAGPPQDRCVFLGHAEPEILADVLSLSDLHVYLSMPFVTSWSLFDAMASGALILAADIPPVHEIMEPGVHGLIEPLFDVDRLAETALRVLHDPGLYAPLAQAARERILERYSLDVCVPKLARYFERAAAAPRQQ